MSPRAAVVLGAVVVALFVAVVVVGVGQGEGSSEEANPFVDRLVGLVGGPATVSLQDIEVTTAGCLDDEEPNRLTFGGGTRPSRCTLSVERDRGLGLVRIIPLSEFQIDAPAPEGDLRVNVEAEPGEELTIAVGEGRTEIVLGCAPLSSCAAELVE